MKSLLFFKKFLPSFAGLCLGWLAMSQQALAYAVTVELPGMPSNVSDPGKYIEYFFSFGLALAGFLAVAAMVVGGVMYMTGGTIGKVEKAKEIMGGAITGIVLLLCSYLLLATIDPTLTKLSPLDPKQFIGGVPPAPPAQQQTQQQIANACAQTGASTFTSAAECTNYCNGQGQVGYYTASDQCCECN